MLEIAERDIENYKMQIRVLEQELEKLGGTIPEGDVLFERAKAEKEKLEQLIDNAE